MNTLFSKFLLRFVMISIIIIIILGFSMIYFFENFYFNQKEGEIISNSRAVSGFLSQALVRNNMQQLENWLQILSEINDGVAMLIDDQGYLQRSYPIVTEQGSRINFPHREEVTAGNVISSRIDSATFDRPMLLIGIPIIQTERTYGLLVLTPVAGINQTINQVQRMMLYSSFIAILIGMVLAYTWSKSLSQPLKQISRVALRLSNGEFGETVSIDEKNEIGTLAQSINYMSRTLKETIEDLVEERNKLKHILTGMDEGVVAVNKEQEIILINKSACNMFGIGDINIEGEKLQEHIIHKEVREVFQDSSQQEKEIQRELTLEKKDKRTGKSKGFKKRILIHCTPVFIEGAFFGIVGLIEDISERWRLEQLQKDFVANVSHELKAPLSSIRGAGEVLIEDVIRQPEKKEEYLNIILEEADRLEGLVNDILDLSELEGKGPAYNSKKINVVHLVHQVANTFSKKIEKNKNQLKVITEDEDIFVEGDEDRIKQVLFNLLDNAFKFTENEEPVEIGISQTQDQVKFWVKDYGIGISKKEQENIWERFYKVEKAHTPADTGSGLGLAIVKKIVEQYDGEVFVQSEPGKGSTFGFLLPAVE